MAVAGDFFTQYSLSEQMISRLVMANIESELSFGSNLSVEAGLVLRRETSVTALMPKLTPAILVCPTLPTHARHKSDETS